MKLEIGYNANFEVRHEICRQQLVADFSVLYLSDLHFNKYSGDMAAKLVFIIDRLNPDIILLGGDYADSKKGLTHLSLLLQSFKKRLHVFAIAGNHDYFFGLETLKELFLTNNISWVENESVTLQLNGNNIRIDGTRPLPGEPNTDFTILCLHQPLDPMNFHRRYNLVFAGHLHGCQFVLWKRKHALYPGKFFYRWNVLKWLKGTCNYFVSKGLGDTLPVRFNCSKDIIFVQVHNNNL